MSGHQHRRVLPTAACRVQGALLDLLRNPSSLDSRSLAETGVTFVPVSLLGIFLACMEPVWALQLDIAADSSAELAANFFKYVLQRRFNLCY